MNKLEVRLVKLDTMRVAAAHGFGTSPETEAWETILRFAEDKGLLARPYWPRFFGFNNPDPTPASPNYGYEQWLTVDDTVTGSDEVEIREVEGGLYAVARFKGLEYIGRVWQELVNWVEESQYEIGQQQCLEELLTPPGVDLDEYIFDLYLPVRE